MKRREGVGLTGCRMLEDKFLETQFPDGFDFFWFRHNL